MTQFDEAARKAVLSTVNLMQSYTDEIIQIDEARFGELKVEVAKHFAEIEAVFGKLVQLAGAYVARDITALELEELHWTNADEVKIEQNKTEFEVSDNIIYNLSNDPQVKAEIERSKE